MLHQPTRLAILVAVHRNRQVAFGRLREDLGLTSGNLSSHAAKLEAAGYLQVVRTLQGLGFEVRLRITPEGSHALARYLALLRTLLEQFEAEPQSLPPPAAGREEHRH